MNRVFNQYKKILFTIACAITFLLALIPAMALAADFPGAEEKEVTGTQAHTDVNLKTDENQLSFTAPSVVNFALKTDGEFVCPSSDNVYIKNNSLMKIKVKSYDITEKSNAHGVSTLSATDQSDTYQITVVGNDGAELPFAVDSSNSWAGWVIGQKDGGSDTCHLTFKNGKMLNPTGSTWFNGAALQEVLWTVTTNVG